MISPADRDILRSLADRYAAHCAAPAMQAKIRRWYDHNDLAPGSDPMVLVFPEGAWGDIGATLTYRCSGGLASALEGQLLQRLYHIEVLRDDCAFEPVIDIGWKVGIGDYGVKVERQHGADRGSFTWTPPIKDLTADWKRLHHREVTLDRAGSEADLADASAVFAGILPVRRRHFPWWTDGMTIDLIDLIGLDRLMTAMCDEADELHAIMAWMRDERLALGRRFEELGLLTDNNGHDYVGSGGYGFTRQLPRPGRAAGAPTAFADRWGFAESQETVGCSPKMFAQFILPYQIPLMNRYGLVCYGCCEGVHARIDPILAAVPNLRRVSVSPWCDQKIIAQKLGRRAIFSRKPNPAMICAGFNETTVREDTRATLAAAASAGCQLEIVMKDTHTVEGQPWRLARWVEIVREEIARWQGRAAA